MQSHLLNLTDKAIVEKLSENPCTTIVELSEIIQLSEGAVNKALKRLKDSGVIRRIGPDRGGHWEVIVINGD